MTLLSLIFLTITAIVQLAHAKTVVVFCDVKQGDGIYIRIENKYDVLIDAGGSAHILSCLGKHMPFYDKKIEYAFLSHPQKDHYGGFTFVLDRYKIDTFVTSYNQTESESYKELLLKLPRLDSRVEVWYAGFNISFSRESQMKLLWPEKEYVENHPHEDPNAYSQVILLSASGKSILFTGDILPAQQKYFLQNIETVDILKIPHHGSKNGLTETFLKKTLPQDSVISVGKNSYGHPAPQILDLLKENKVNIKRTDKDGDVFYVFN